MQIPQTQGSEDIRFNAKAEFFGHEHVGELINHSPLAIAVTVGSDHRYAFASRLYGLIFAGRGDPLLGTTAAQAIILPDRQEILTRLHRVLETGEGQEFGSLPQSDGASQQFWDIKFLPVRDQNSNVRGVLSLATNVTDRVAERLESKRQAWTAMMDSERFKLAVEATDLGFWDWNARTREVYWSARQREIFGIPRDQPLTDDSWIAAIHPEDQNWVLDKVGALNDPHSTGQFQIEYRIVRPDGEIRCISSVGRMLYETIDNVEQPVRLLGTILDVTERYRNAEIRQLLVHELDHRVKNLFALASGIVTLSARTAQSPQEMALAICGRLDALARAHDLIRLAITGEVPSDSAPSVETVIRTIMLPHCESDLSSQAIVEGPFVPIDPRAATSLTLVLHELATNASKYGALSCAGGRLRCTWSVSDKNLVLQWQESQGPILTQPPATQGFGSKLVLRTVTDQLAGTIHHDWRPEGLSVRISVPLKQLTRETNGDEASITA